MGENRHIVTLQSATPELAAAELSSVEQEIEDNKANIPTTKEQDIFAFGRLLIVIGCTVPLIYKKRRNEQLVILANSNEFDIPLESVPNKLVLDTIHGMLRKSPSERLSLYDFRVTN